MKNFIIRLKKESDNPAVDKLIMDSLNVWYRKNRGFDVFVPSLEAASIFTRIYDQLDPDCCVVAEDPENGALAGACFYHPRSTHVALGIMNVAPDYFGQKVSSKILNYVVDFAKERNQVLRLVSSSMNLDSFSVYSKAGFVPRAMFRDVKIEVPAEGFDDSLEGATLRDAELADVDAIVELELELYGVERAKDYRFFIENKDGIWGTSVLVNDETGAINGVMASARDPGSNMVGPGAVRTERQAAALIKRELNRYKGEWAPIVLIPTDCVELGRETYAMGGVNTETHVAQTLGEAPVKKGVIIPTFMPETA
ncbi:MAG: GNAT family N-acetyltransferase [Thermoguttaceae bacterium]|jgi:GNAT superfamily N-acetyltransferase|nr:GNAT family N-acetyltransferase [Thermoguttaceae bacterium]